MWDIRNNSHPKLLLLGLESFKRLSSFGNIVIDSEVLSTPFKRKWKQLWNQELDGWIFAIIYKTSVYEKNNNFWKNLNQWFYKIIIIEIFYIKIISNLLVRLIAYIKLMFVKNWNLHLHEINQWSKKSFFFHQWTSYI